MSFSLLRQVCRRSQASMYRRASQAAAVRLNSTSAESPQDENAIWTKTIHDNLPGTEGTPHLQTIEAKWERSSEVFMQQRFPPRNAYTGRSVPVMNGDVAKAARQLDILLSQNNVGKDWFTNRRHKPKGEERRKLISIRWRRRFKHEVGKKVELVQQIRRRGA